MNRKFILKIIVFILSFLLSGYCFMGAIMIAWISATPGIHDLDVLEFRLYIWIFFSVFFLLFPFLYSRFIRNN